VSTNPKAADTDWRDMRGPFDIIGDVHGCADELVELMRKLGYSVRLEGEGDKRRAVTTAPQGRRAFFVGDLVDRGPKSPDVLRIVMDMVAAGQAFCVPGNHDDKLLRWLKGREVKIGHGLERTIAQLDGASDAFKARIAAFVEGLPYHAWLEGGALAIAHAGVRENMLGRNSPNVRSFCLFGDTSGRPDENGLPERFDWAADYHGKTPVVYGHTPVAEPEWLNNTVCIDTGCVFGGKLTALRWPERELVSVPAHETYAVLRRGFGLPPRRPQGQVAR
jgi:protein phosphatase